MDDLRGCIVTVSVAVLAMTAIAVAYGLVLGWFITLVWNNWLIGWTHWPSMPLWVAFLLVVVIAMLIPAGHAKEKVGG